jgi:hypothetical protein
MTAGGGAPSAPRRRALKNIGEQDGESKILVERKRNRRRRGLVIWGQEYPREIKSAKNAEIEAERGVNYSRGSSRGSRRGSPSPSPSPSSPSPSPSPSWRSCPRRRCCGGTRRRSRSRSRRRRRRPGDSGTAFRRWGAPVLPLRARVEREREREGGREMVEARGGFNGARPGAGEWRRGDEGRCLSRGILHRLIVGSNG